MMGSAPSKSTVKHMKRQPLISVTPEHVHEEEKDNAAVTLHEDLQGRLVKAEERAKEAENIAPKTAKEVIVM